MKLTHRLAIGLFGFATVIAGAGAIAEAYPLQLRAQRGQPQVRPVQTVTQIAPQIPPRPDNCAPDFSWFDYEKWEWICVGHW